MAALDHHDPDCDYTIESLYAGKDYNDIMYERAISQLNEESHGIQS